MVETEPQKIDSDKRAQNYGTASFVLGVLGLLCCLSGAGGILGIALAIIGVVLGSKARKALPADQRGLATAGWVCSIIALCIFAAGVIFLGSLLTIFF